ncbi:MAG: 23S rRNA (uracil(1939)-C(5))-methyltransferase RlmD [Steroidobacteraceae bacterium]|nr:23S rRNA (uracil(1939)-C(5))-methyltransferase RlmD [Steroidobacteraceae bacterium]
MKRLSVAPEEADIVDLSHEAKGVARVDGKAVFVADSLPGERVVMRRVGRHRRYDEAVLEQVLRASADRVPAECPHFGLCGGCALQHLAPAAQLAFKQAQLIENLARLGDVEPGRVLDPLTGPVWAYRRRARLGVKLVPKKGRVLVGFRERSAPYVADLHECRVLVPPAGALMDPLAALVAKLSIAARMPQVEVAVADNACALVLRVLDEPSAADLDLLAGFEREHAVRIYLQPGGIETIRPLGGAVEPLHYLLPAFGLRIEFEPADFIQVNGALNEAMVSRAVDLLDPGPGHRVLDLFCGLGNFSLPLATRAGQVVGIEGEQGLVERARRNAVLNGLANTAFYASNLEGDMSEATWTRGGYDRVLLDPPRAGAREVLPVVGASGAARVVYISCHPGSLARDAGILVREHGFRLAAAGVMDMFPHTTHVEAMAVFER